METGTLKDKYAGTLLGLAVGDALGMPVESRTRQEIAAEFGVLGDYRAGYLPKGHYTDDTQQTIILADSLIRHQGFNLEDYIAELISNTTPERGAGPSLRRFLTTGKKAGNSSLDASESIYPSNGLAMKISPVSLFYYKNPSKIDGIIEQLSSITHRHRASLAGAVAIAQAVWYALHQSTASFTRKEFLSYVTHHVMKYDSEMADRITEFRLIEDNTCSVYSTVPNAVLQFANMPADFYGGIVSLVNSGGDTDTKAAMFGAISGAFNGVRAIPKEWVEGLENGREGKDYIICLAERLFDVEQADVN